MSEPVDWCPTTTTPDPSSALPDYGIEVRPDLADPTAANHILSKLCLRVWRPSLLSGFIVKLLRDHFSQDSTIMDPILKGKLWKNDTTTEVSIAMSSDFNADLVNMRPALILKRNAFQQQRIGLNDVSGKDQQGNEQYCTKWIGSHSVFCLTGSGDGSETLSGEVIGLLTELGPIFRRYLRLDRWSVMDVSAVGKLKESRDSYAVVVNVGWAFDHTWTLRYKAPVLANIAVSELIR